MTGPDARGYHPPMNLAKYGAIFDLDGTLVASERFYQIATSWILKKAGRSLDELTPEERAAIPGRSALQNMRFYAERFELPWTPEFLVAKRMELVEDLVRSQGVMLIPGVFEFCQMLKAEPFGMAVASSSPGSYVRLILEVTGLEGFFDTILSGDDVSRYKPDPEIFLSAADRLGLPPRQCVVFEDADSGLRAAAAAGMKSVLIDNETIMPAQKQNATLTVPHYCGLVPADVKRVINGSIILMN